MQPLNTSELDYLRAEVKRLQRLRAAETGKQPSQAGESSSEFATMQAQIDRLMEDNANLRRELEEARAGQ